MQLAGQLDGNVEKAIKRIALEKREKKTISKNFKTNRNEKNLKIMVCMVLLLSCRMLKHSGWSQILQIWLKE
jgi:hypothetical protein